MNNNNLYNTNTFIGTTHQDYFKISSNNINTQITITSNILEQHINTTSNLLDIRASNFTTNTSNLILQRYDPLIKEQLEDILLPIPTTFKHTYITNSNILGEIRFWCKSTSDFIVFNPVGVPDYRVKIDVDGKLKVYYTYDPAINLTFLNGWVDVANSIAALNASDANIGISISGLEAQIVFNFNFLDGKIQALLGSLMGHGIISEEAYDNIDETLEMFTNDEFASKNTIDSIFTNIRQAFNTARIDFLNDAITSILYNISVNPQTAFFLGVGGVAFGFAVGFIQNQGYLNTISARIDEKLSSNTVITPARRAAVLESNAADIRNTYTELCSNMYNFSLAQGFINSNIQTPQYISSIKCDNLDLNTGNISGINYVNVNNIVADGKIKENNKFLDATYLTSNHLYNLAYGYSSEREYPPKTFTTATPETTTTFLNKLVYKQTLFLDTTFITHGNGYYEIYSSSTYDIDTPKSLLFNHNTSDLKNARWFINLYEFGTGLYQGDNSIDGSYYGDWVIIKLPQPIVLTKFRFYTGGAVNSSPGTWKCYGSNDGLIFTEITEGSQTTSITTGDYSSGYYEKSLNPSFTTLYQYFGFVVNKLVSINSFRELRFGELRLYGKEVISNSITSSIYTTSNVCKNLIIYDTPQVYKRSAFYCFTDEVIYPNGGSTPYYTHHIDLRLYTKTGYTVQNDPYRIFKIKCFFETSYFQKLTNGTPDICEYSIHMSSKAAAGGEGSIAGINIMAIGTPQNYFLNNIMNTNLFILRNGNNNFNYLSIVSTQNADVRVFITDELN